MGSPRRSAAWSVLVALVLAGCGAAPSAPPDSIALNPALSARTGAAPAAFRAIELAGPLHPAAQSVAPSPEALHALFAARLEDTVPAAPDGLVAQYDALEWHGAAWVLDAASPRFHPRAALAARGQPHPRRVARAPGVLAAGPVPAADWAALAAGATVVARQPDGALRLLGPIHAAPGCLACHDWHAGQLIGAYEYRFTELADD